jgi:periplasmic copper chaperone A
MISIPRARRRADPMMTESHSMRHLSSLSTRQYAQCCVIECHSGWDNMPAISSNISKLVSATSVATVMLVAGSAAAHEFKVGALAIGHPWSRPTPKDADIAGGYLTITNKGRTSDRLMGGSSPAASRIEVHEMATVDGATKTRPVQNGLEIKPGQKVELKPGSYRILLFGLKEPLNLGQKVKATLQFEKAGSVDIVYNVEENPDALKGAAAGAPRAHH